MCFKSYKVSSKQTDLKNFQITIRKKNKVSQRMKSQTEKLSKNFKVHEQDQTRKFFPKTNKKKRLSPETWVNAEIFPKMIPHTKRSKSLLRSKHANSSGNARSQSIKQSIQRID